MMGESVNLLYLQCLFPFFPQLTLDLLTPICSMLRQLLQCDMLIFCLLCLSVFSLLAISSFLIEFLPSV